VGSDPPEDGLVGRTVLHGVVNDRAVLARSSGWRKDSPCSRVSTLDSPQISSRFSEVVTMFVWGSHVQAISRPADIASLRCRHVAATDSAASRRSVMSRQEPK